MAAAARTLMIVRGGAADNTSVNFSWVATVTPPAYSQFPKIAFGFIMAESVFLPSRR
jgi:hypothetical protein